MQSNKLLYAFAISAGMLCFSCSKLPEMTFGAAQIGIPPILPAALGNDAGLIGAAFL